MRPEELNNSVNNPYNFIDEAAFIAADDYYFSELMSKIDHDMQDCIKMIKEMEPDQSMELDPLMDEDLEE
jgi:hypothetical protein